MQKSLYESGLFLEQAFVLCRLLKTQISQLKKDSSQMLAVGWDWIFESLNIKPPSGKLLNEESKETKDFCMADAYTLADYLTFEKSHQGSIFVCLSNSKKAAKGLLDEVSSHQMEGCLHYLEQNKMTRIWPEKALSFYDNLIKRILFFYGVSDNCLYRGEGYNFLQLGRFSAKFEHTLSLLKTHSRFIYGWKDTQKELSSLLIYCGLEHSYKQVFGSDMNIQKVFDFIMREAAAVGSLHFSLLQLEHFCRKENQNNVLDASIQSLKHTLSQPKKGDLDSFLESIVDQFFEVKQNMYQNYFKK